MHVTTIKATVRKSIEMRGGWYTMETSAEADVTEDESSTWQDCQNELITDLRSQVNAHFAQVFPKK